MPECALLLIFFDGFESLYESAAREARESE
jgi:hypothetical protein